MPKPESGQPWVRASEIGEYTYCARAWSLHHLRGLTPDDQAPLQAGVCYHQSHGRRVWLLALSQNLAWLILGLALLALLIALLQRS